MDREQTRNYLRSSGMSEEQIEEIERGFKGESCDDAISRQAVLDLMQLRLMPKEEYMAICDLPSVTPQTKTGHWRHYEGMLICSECGTEFYDDIMEYCGDDVPKCCPNCGLRMVEPQESEE